MKRALVGIVLVFSSVAFVPAAEETEKWGGGGKAVEKGVEYLSNHQNDDGSWNSAQGPKNAAITGLSVMAFLSAGHVPGEGKYGDTIKKGVEWVLKQQQTNGLIATQRHYEMYQHGICTLMLAEVAGMTDGKLGEEIRTKLAKAVEIIFKEKLAANQGEGGGCGRQLGENSCGRHRCGAAARIQDDQP